MQAQHRWFRFGGRAGQATARWDADPAEPVRPEACGREPCGWEPYGGPYGEPCGPAAGVRRGADRPGPVQGIGGSTGTAEPHTVQNRSGRSAPCPSGQGGRSNSRSSPQVEQCKGDLPRL